MKRRRAKLHKTSLSFEWGEPFGVCRAPHSPGLDAWLAVCWNMASWTSKSDLSSRCVVKSIWDMRTPLCSSFSNLEPRQEGHGSGQGKKCQCVYSMILRLPGLRSKPLGGKSNICAFSPRWKGELRAQLLLLEDSAAFKLQESPRILSFQT